MKYIIPVLAIFIFTACTKGKSVSVPYDMPPSAPVPPEQFCYIQTGGASSAALRLTITGDSVIGQIDFAKTQNQSSANITGVIYGSTLIVSYQYQLNDQLLKQDQEWKLLGDTVYRVIRTKITDTTQALNGVYGPMKFYKVPCK